MNRSESDISSIQEWRKRHNLIADRETLTRALDFIPPDPKNFHFFNYDPTLGPTDLSNISFKNDENHDSAVFSIPLSFTENSKSKFQSHDDTTKGLDIQAYMTPHNAPIYPLKR
ncbi:hypothetical protein M9Y10_012854 [Tritrichomonas musculus]|uniref:Uncharacterized protein n=1 Tax=Tritrichomonas musculus TaxID=1915356 RepID=A0ABR2IDJ4_9EUKA